MPSAEDNELGEDNLDEDFDMDLDTDEEIDDFDQEEAREE